MKKEKKRIVLAEGEVTGHAHVIESDSAEEMIVGGERKIKTLPWTPVKHEEHTPIITPGGIGEISIVTEYNPLTDKMGRVSD